MTYEEGDLTRPGKHNVFTGNVASGTVTKGGFYKITAGDVVPLVAAANTISGAYVALETVTFQAGKENLVQLAGAGSHVVVKLGGGMSPGALVKITSDDKVVVAGATDVGNSLTVGRYIKHPGEKVASNGADTELGVVLLGAA